MQCTSAGAPNFERPFKLEVNRNLCGAGAVLLQEDEQGIEHPVCYFLKKFNKHQLYYSTIEKEALALLLPLQYFKVYIGSSVQPVRVFTASFCLPTAKFQPRTDVLLSVAARF